MEVGLGNKVELHYEFFVSFCSCIRFFKVKMATARNNDK